MKRMRAGWPKVLVLVLSMHSERLYAERALRAGARGYIMKEESPKTVMAAIRRILAGGVHVSESVQSMLVERVASGRNTSGRASVEILSNRELDVLRLIGSGFGTRRIAEHLQRSVKTISPIGRTSRTNWASRAPLSWSSMPRFGCTNIQSVNT
ncbi:MAG: response regulator transcription factor [Gemmatimonadetes bacterium]|nr:response regulator transcription factor [Gemmatimonadota bacterium]